MPASYGQFCPVAKAMELLDERWTLLVVRELMMGSRHFNDLRRGLPRISPTLLSRRLQTLTRAGVVDRWEDGNRVTYELSTSGKELEPIVAALGAWGVRWVSEVGDEDLDPNLLMWDVHRNIAVDLLPPGRTVLRFVFDDVVAPQTSEWWIVATLHEVDVCDDDPGFDVRVSVLTSLRLLTHVWRGVVTWGAAISAGGLELEGSTQSRRAVTTWLKLSPLAPVPRPSVAVLAN